MPADPPTARRADARRNREHLIAVATRAFASGSERVSLNAIARAAGVGPGTLYRHFPTRDDLVEAVYDDQIARLRDGARRLLEIEAPATALRRWMELFADWAATKHGMVDSLGAIVAAGRIGHGQMRSELIAIVGSFLDAGARVGELRGDVEPADLAAVLAGVLVVAGGPEQRHQMVAMLEIVMDGVRA